MKIKFKTLIFIIAPTILVITLVGLGFFVGRFLTVKPFRTLIDDHAKGESLGNLLSDDRKKGIAKAYYDGENIIGDIDNFSWSVPNTFTPFVGNAPMPGIHNNAYINLRQFRASHEIIIPKPSHVYRIIITGGSTAFGSGAPGQNMTIAGYLEKILYTDLSPLTNLDYEVLTMANPAWVSTHERIIIENRLSEFEPDMILSFSGNNDVHWAQRGRNTLWFRSYTDDFFFKLMNTAYQAAGHELMPNIIEIETSPIHPSLVVERLLKNVRLSSYALSMDAITYVFILQPTLAVSQKGLTEREQRILRIAENMIEGNKEYFIDCYARIDSSMRKFKMSNFHYINLTDIFDKMNDSEDIFIDSYHFADKGNEIIATNIFKRFREVLVNAEISSKPN